MTDIIFEYRQGETNWLNPIWAKAEKRRRLQSNVIWVENYYTDWTNKQKANRIEISESYYKALKNKFNLVKGGKNEKNEKSD